MELLISLSLCIFVFVGFLLIRVFSLLPIKPTLLVLPYAFGLGIGVIAFQMYVYSRIAISWTLPNLLLPWIALGSIVLWKKKDVLPVITLPKVKRSDVFLLGLIAVLLSFVAFESTLRPVVAWDGWAIWLLKSKIFFLDGGIRAPIFQYVESSYPILVSLMYTFLYVAIGSVDDRSVLLLSFAFYFMLGIGFFVYLKERTSITFALFGTFLLLSTQNILRHGGRFEAGQADIVMAFYILICSILLVEFLTKKSFKILILLQLLLGVTALVKNEGLVFSIFVQLILGFWAIRKNMPSFILSSVIWLIPVVDWEYYKLNNSIPKLHEVFVGNTVHFASVLPIIQAMGGELLNIQNWNLLWVLFFVVVLFLHARLLKSAYWMLFILLFLQLGFYFCLYLVFPNNPVELVNSSFNRLLLQLAPLALLLTLLEVYPLIKSIKNIV